uniref:BPTI/Kunitz inhibitor domain-containing protein n=1 Tax=Amblyomma triste TaxID=251400 RepID=A0A023G1R7_AMBTT
MMSGSFGILVLFIAGMSVLLLAEGRANSKKQNKTCEYPKGCFSGKPRRDGKEMLLRYFYNHTEGKCRNFLGSDRGCNNFYTRKECRKICLRPLKKENYTVSQYTSGTGPAAASKRT